MDQIYTIYIYIHTHTHTTCNGFIVTELFGSKPKIGNKEKKNEAAYLNITPNNEAINHQSQAITVSYQSWMHGNFKKTSTKITVLIIW